MSTTVTITVIVDSPGALANQAAIESATLDPDEDNNLATEDTAVLAVPDLCLAKTDSADPVLVGTNYVYELAVSNIGSAAATNVSLTDTLPVGVSFVSALSSQGTCTESSGTVICSLLPISVGETVSLEIAVTALASGLVRNCASVTTNEDESNVTNNNATETTTIVDASPQPSTSDLQLTKTASVDSVNINSEFLFTITVQNIGTANATGVSLVDELPSGLSVSNIDASQGTCVLDGLSINCSLGEMEPDAIVTVTIMAQAEATGILVNTATVSALETDPTPEDNNDTAQIIARAADAIPTLTEWGLILLTGLLLLFGVRRLRNGQSQLAG